VQEGTAGRAERNGRHIRQLPAQAEILDILEKAAKKPEAYHYTNMTVNVLKFKTAHALLTLNIQFPRFHPVMNQLADIQVVSIVNQNEAVRLPCLIHHLRSAASSHGYLVKNNLICCR
jgi:hypothetical protein